ncbi:MAG TPA: tetratricopeptide repeat protein [Terriglobales bacterium]|nr:tetratricopeptide repeat protein [Terriglobales bacterium]
MKRLSLLLLLAAALAPARLVAQAAAPPATRILLVMPFDNLSQAPGLDWIGESFPEVMGERLGTGNLFLVSRADRLYAFDRLGIPASVHPSRATVLRIAEAMDADYVVLGSYTFDGQTFGATAQLLDMRRLHLSPEMKESGPLVKLLDIQNALAWDVLRLLNPALTLSRNEFVAAAPPIRLDALEAYMRGTIAGSDEERIPYFRRAVRLNPSYARAQLELGKAYFNTKDYESAAATLAHVPRSDPLGREASFYLGLACYYLGQFQRAQEAFDFVASVIPLSEVTNNLGVVAARRGQAQARQYFQRAVEADPNNPDYHFNLAVSLARAGETAGAARELRAALELHPQDSEAESLQQALTAAGALPLPAGKLPLERIELGYDETSYRQLAMEIENVSEMRLSQLDDRTHARAHADRGREMLAQGYLPEAEKQFREAITLDPTNAAAHAGLAQALEKRLDYAGARAEAQASLRLQPSVEAYLVLARLDLRDNKIDEAARSVEQALGLAPGDAAALALEREIAAQRAQKAPPLPKP